MKKLISAVLLLGLIGGAGMHASAAKANEVQPVRQLFTTAAEVTALDIQEDGSAVSIRPGEGEEIQVHYVDTTAEKLYDIRLEEGTLVVEKLSAPPAKVVWKGLIRMEFTVADDYELEILLPQRQYEAITLTNPTNGGAELGAVDCKQITVELKNGSAAFSQTQADTLKAEVVNGSVKLEQTDAAHYECTVKNGSVQGEIAGESSDYSVDVQVKNGSCNLLSRPDSRPDPAKERSLRLAVINGKISVRFGS